MKFQDFGLLTDENVDPEVVAFLRGEGFDIWGVRENGKYGASDIELLRRAVAEHRVVVTHDSDFGALAVLAGEPIVGLLYLRPGHFDPQFTIATIRSLLNADLDLTPPFIVVARRTGTTVTIRIRAIGV